MLRCCGLRGWRGMTFRTRHIADPVSFANDSDRDLLNFERSRSEQDSSVRVFVASMQFCASECFHESVRQGRSLDCIRRLGRCTLPMAAREADRSHLPDIGLFRYFILAYTQRTSDDGAVARVTRVCGEVKILFPHCGSLEDEELTHNARPSWLRYLVTIALACAALELSAR
jgi:hypothetical protein